MRIPRLDSHHTLLLFISLFLVVPTTFAQKKATAAASGPATKRDPEITRIVREIDAKNIERTIRKLVSFGTRNTLSEQNDPNRGIGAARDWLYSQFQQYSKDCGGCLDVQKQAFTQPKAARVPEPTTLTNVFAVLKGTTDPARTYVISG